MDLVGLRDDAQEYRDDAGISEEAKGEGDQRDCDAESTGRVSRDSKA